MYALLAYQILIRASIFYWYMRFSYVFHKIGYIRGNHKSVNIGRRELNFFFKLKVIPNL